MKKKKLDAKTKAKAAITFSHFTFLLRVGFVISQWICLLAVLEPRIWMPYAHAARWAYAAFYLAFPPGFLFLGFLLLKLSTPTRLIVVRWCLISTYSAAMLFFLFDERFSAALLLTFGGAPLNALTNWLLPFKEKDDGALAPLKNWFLPFKEQDEKTKPFRGSNAITSSVFFILLIGALEFHSVLLSTSLFVGVLGYMTVSFLRKTREFFREMQQQK